MILLEIPSSVQLKLISAIKIVVAYWMVIMGRLVLTELLYAVNFNSFLWSLLLVCKIWFDISTMDIISFYGLNPILKKNHYDFRIESGLQLLME